MPGAGSDAPRSPPQATLRNKIRAWARLAVALAVTLALLPAEFAFRAAGGSADRMVAAVWSRALLFCLGLRLQRQGRPIESGLIAANHSSWIDPLAIGAAAPAFFVAKREVRSWPGIGWLCRLGRVEFVERRPSAAKSQVGRLSERLAKSHLLCVFPEGTSSDGFRVLPFRSSLFASVLEHESLAGEAIVQPVAILYRPDSSLPANLYAWWGEMTFAGHLLDVVAHSCRGTVTVSFLDPVHASSYPDRKSLARAVEEVVARRFAVEFPAQPRHGESAS